MSMRRTKLVATIGPASCARETLAQLLEAGVDVARLNFAHGTRAAHGRVMRDLRKIAARTGRAVAVLQDLAGPKIRTGPLAQGRVSLEPGQSFLLTPRDVPGDSTQVSVTYKNLAADVRAGDVLLLSDGALELSVDRISGGDLACRVVVGGKLAPYKGINLPARSIRAPFLTEKDKTDLLWGIEMGVDYVALSFVRSAADVARVRKAMAAAGRSVPLVAKIEKHEALNNIDAIMDAVDGIMVARGDLGVEIPIEQIPGVQKTLIAKANLAAKPVITATQMLMSMTENPRPSRAEVTDVANAVVDGTDAVMLSEETAVGAYPLDTVRMMSRIAAAAETTLDGDPRSLPLGREACSGPQESVARSACRMAQDIGAAAIVTCTQSGSTTRLVTRHRPRQPVFGVTPDQDVDRRLALVWGAVPMHMPPADNQEEMEAAALECVREAGMLESGQTVILTAGVPLHVPGCTNMIKVTTVP